MWKCIRSHYHHQGSDTKCLLQLLLHNIGQLARQSLTGIPVMHKMITILNNKLGLSQNDFNKAMTYPHTAQESQSHCYVAAHNCKKRQYWTPGDGKSPKYGQIRYQTTKSMPWCVNNDDKPQDKYQTKQQHKECLRLHQMEHWCLWLAT